MSDDRRQHSTAARLAALGALVLLPLACAYPLFEAELDDASDDEGDAELGELAAINSAVDAKLDSALVELAAVVD
ncbi:hypothetical protein, partial [Enhygromyxa salina]|uniref:hypothetical protein n=1 Tax=Enhygromyxa salina TaxID=215803 RepID=UPI0011B225A6